MYSNSGGYS